MRYAARRQQDISVSTTPLEVVIPLEQPLKIYSAKELAAMKRPKGRFFIA